MEEAMQKDADSVLSEVTKKKSDARKQLSLIGALVKLRTVRDNVANHRGEKPSLEDKRAFSVTTEKLVKMWENSLQIYLKEEQGLRLMLGKSEVCVVMCIVMFFFCRKKSNGRLKASQTSQGTQISGRVENSSVRPIARTPF